jgi:hypothetical protein
VYRPTYWLRGFDGIAEGHRFAVLEHLVETLVAMDAAWLLSRPQTPPLYRSGVRYEPTYDERAVPGLDDWQDVAECLDRGTGTCADLVAWRVAELRVRHRERARVRITVHESRTPRGTHATYHITLWRADGRVEDPSRLLGMK